MSSDYFDSSNYQQTAGTRARASSINTALDALDTGLALLPSEANLKRGLINYAVDSGAADAYVVTLTYAPASYTDGMQVVFKASAVNTGACTINVNALGVKSITRQDGTAPVAGDIGANKITEIRYNSTSGQFEIQGSIGAASGTGTMAAQNANAVDITGGTIAGATVDGGTVGGSSAGDIVTIDDTQTLTGKRLTSPKVNEDVAVAATATELNTAADGISNPPIAGDSTAGRVLRKTIFVIEDGTNATTVKMSTTLPWNESSVSTVDNIADDTPSGGFSFTEGTSYFYARILDANITGTPVALLSADITYNTTGTLLSVEGRVFSSDIQLQFWQAPNGSNITLTTLVDSGDIRVSVTYLTDA
jgi:hypothetical protein